MKIVEESMLAGFIFLLAYFIIDKIDSSFFIPKLIKSARQSEQVCNISPENCWYQERKPND